MNDETMTAKQLIRFLSKYDPDTPIRVQVEAGGGWYAVAVTGVCEDNEGPMVTADGYDLPLPENDGLTVDQE